MDGEDGQLVEDEQTAQLLFLWRGDHPRTHGKCMQTSSYNDVVWKPALAKAGVIPVPEPGPRGGTPRYTSVRENGTHTLRHYFSTTLLDAGVSLGASWISWGTARRGPR